MPLPRLLVWAERGQESFVRSAAQGAGMEIVAAGSPAVSVTGELARALGAEEVSDLRRALLRDDIDAVWIAAPGGLDAAARARLRALEQPVFSSEPRPAALAEIIADPEEGATALFVPLFRRSEAWRLADTARSEFGKAQLITIEVQGPPEAGSLFARLYDALDVLDAVAGAIGEVDAVTSGPLAHPADSLSAMHGHLSAIIRFGDNRAAAIVASNGSPRWHRQVRFTGGAGELLIDDHGLTWTGSDNTPVEHTAVGDPVSDPALVVGRQMAARLARGPATDQTVRSDVARVMALCEACRLSARTAGPMTTDRVLHMTRDAH